MLHQTTINDVYHKDVFDVKTVGYYGVGGTARRRVMIARPSLTNESRSYIALKVGSMTTKAVTGINRRHEKATCTQQYYSTSGGSVCQGRLYSFFEPQNENHIGCTKQQLLTGITTLS